MDTNLMVFGAMAGIACLAAIGVVAFNNPVRSALCLVVNFFVLAFIYFALNAQLLGITQILVYTGAIMVLFLFVIMLLGPASLSGRDTRTAIPRYLGMIVFSASAASALYFLYKHSAGKLTTLPKPPAGYGTVEAIGHQLFTADLVPFEITGALLLIAAVGAIAVARGKQPDPTLHPAGPAQDNSPEGTPALAAKESAK